MDPGDLVYRLSEIPGQVSETVRGLPEEGLRRSFAGGWSVMDYVAHMAAASRDYHAQIARLAGEEVEDEGADADGDTQEIEALLASLVLSRAKTIDILRDLDEEKWGRQGDVPGLGEVSLRELVQYVASHEGDHVSTLRGLRRKAESATL